MPLVFIVVIMWCFAVDYNVPAAHYHCVVSFVLILILILYVPVYYARMDVCAVLYVQVQYDVCCQSPCFEMNARATWDLGN